MILLARLVILMTDFGIGSFFAFITILRLDAPLESLRKCGCPPFPSVVTFRSFPCRPVYIVKFLEKKQKIKQRGNEFSVMLMLRFGGGVGEGLFLSVPIE